MGFDIFFWEHVFVKFCYADKRGLWMQFSIPSSVQLSVCPPHCCKSTQFKMYWPDYHDIWPALPHFSNPVNFESVTFSTAPPLGQHVKFAYKISQKIISWLPWYLVQLTPRKDSSWLLRHYHVSCIAILTTISKILAFKMYSADCQWNVDTTFMFPIW